MMELSDRVMGIDVDKIIKAHSESVAAGKGLRKLTKREVSRVTSGGYSYIVKAYRRTSLMRLCGFRPGKTSGTMLLHGLTPPCLADFCRGAWQYIIYADAGEANFFFSQDLQRECDNLDEAYAGAGRLLAQMHARNLYHVDCKPTNFVWNTLLHNLPPVVIVDCDRVLHYVHGLPAHRVAFNLAQFLAGGRPFGPPALLPHLLEVFLLAYREETKIPPERFRQLLMTAVKIGCENHRIEKNAPPGFLRRDWSV